MESYISSFDVKYSEKTLKKFKKGLDSYQKVGYNNATCSILSGFLRKEIARKIEEFIQ